MKKILLTCVLGLFVSAVWAAAPPFKMADEYSVDMVSRAQGKEHRSKMFVTPNKVRVENDANGQKMIMISRIDQNKAYNVMPNQGMYMEIPLPKEAWKMGKVPGNATWEKIGSENINGQDCDKYKAIFSDAGKNFESLYWVGKKTHFPVRVQTQGHTTDWVNFKAGKQPDNLFEPPAGMQKMDMGNMGNMMKMMQQNQ